MRHRPTADPSGKLDGNPSGNRNRVVPSALYTDENPATTIHGLGYKDASVARRTLRLTSQPGVRYKQYWTIRAMRERAAFHAHPTAGTRDAIRVFDAWLDERERTLRERTPAAALEEKRAAEEEWRAFRALCASSANQHSYGKVPGKDELRRVREDRKVGRELLMKLLVSPGGRASKRRHGEAAGAEHRSDARMRIPFPITAWTALFGAPGQHGYGRHDIAPSHAAAGVSTVHIDGHQGLAEIVGDGKASSPALGGKALVGVDLEYDRDAELVTARAVEVRRPRTTLTALWQTGGGDHSTPRPEGVAAGVAGDAACARAAKEGATETAAAAWTCHACTLEHVGRSKVRFLACELCGTERSPPSVAPSSDDCRGAPLCPGKMPQSQSVFRKALLAGTGETKQQQSSDETPQPTASDSEAALEKGSGVTMQPVIDKLDTKAHAIRSVTPQQQWKSILQSPTACTAQRSAHRKRRRKALEAPPPTMDHIVVLDFEWTADEGRKMEPAAEITQFPSVCLRLSEHGRDGAQSESRGDGEDVPRGLRPLPAGAAKRRDAVCISTFDSYVRPTLNPVMTEFSVRLTAITQDIVDAAPAIDAVLPKYLRWLRSLGLVDDRGRRNGNWAFATWGDCDIMTTLRLELQCKRIELPPCFDRWINLKSDSVYKKHYRRAPRGGLRHCVEAIGAEWEGRAHNGLVDSINTAKIVRDMVQNGFRFVRPTRGLDKSGRPFGQRRVD